MLTEERALGGAEDVWRAVKENALILIEEDFQLHSELGEVRRRVVVLVLVLKVHQFVDGGNQIEPGDG